MPPREAFTALLGDYSASGAIAFDDYEWLHRYQHGRCGICGTAPEKPLRLDLAKNGAARGLLCLPCIVDLHAHQKASTWERARDFDLEWRLAAKAYLRERSPHAAHRQSPTISTETSTL